jgi:excisionase family DNA binding protein
MLSLMESTRKLGIDEATVVRAANDGLRPARHDLRELRPSGPAGPPAHDEEATDDLPEVLTVDELAKLLRVERKTVYAAIGRGEIPGVRRIGSLLRASRDAVLAWLAQGQGRVSRSRRSP